eukprot:PhF_6_TR10389/c0_g1_i2/m.16236
MSSMDLRDVALVSVVTIPDKKRGGGAGVTNSHLFIPRTPSEYVSVLNSVPKIIPMLAGNNVVRRRFAQLYVSYIFDGTLGDPGVMTKLDFGCLDARVRCDFMYSEWNKLMKSANLESHSDALVPVIEACSHILPTIKYRGDTQRCLGSICLTIDTLMQHTLVILFIGFACFIALLVMSLYNGFFYDIPAFFVLFYCLILSQGSLRKRDSQLREEQIQTTRLVELVARFLRRVKNPSLVPEMSGEGPDSPLRGSYYGEDGLMPFACNVDDTVNNSLKNSSQLSLAGSSDSVVGNMKFSSRFDALLPIAASHLSNACVVFGFNVHSLQITHWNTKCVQVTGFNEHEVRDLSILDMLVNDASKAAIDRLLKKDAPSNISKLVLLSCNSIFVEVSVLWTNVVSFDDGDDLFIVGSPLVYNVLSPDDFVKSFVQNVHSQIMWIETKLDKIIASHVSFLSAPSQLMHYLKKVSPCLLTEHMEDAARMWSSCLAHNVNVQSLIGRVVEENAAVARSAGVRVDVIIQESTPRYIHWDEKKLKDLLVRTVIAAIDHHRVEHQDMKVVTIETKTATDMKMLQITVTDNAKPLEASFVCSLESYISLSEHYKCDDVDFESPLSVNPAFSYKSHYDSLAQSVEFLNFNGGTMWCTAAETGTKMTVMVPLFNKKAENRCESAMSTRSAASLRRDPLVQCDMQGESSNAETREPLEVAVFEPHPVINLNITQLLWGKGHLVIPCADVSMVNRAIEERKPNLVIFDIDNTLSTSSQWTTMAERCQELESLFVVCTQYPKKTPKGLISLPKPVSESVLSGILKTARDIVQRSRERDSQIATLRKFFTEYHRCSWERGEQLGVGQFGTVYLATNILTNGKMAVKVLTLDTKSKEIEERTQSFLNEIGIMRTLEHPNVIHYFYCDRVQEGVYIFMEYAEKGSLETLYKKCNIGISRIKRIICEILCGLVYIHSRNIVHRDIKAANILLTSRRVMLADFGCATQIKNGETKGCVGTPRWMAPEVMKGASYNQSCDIWSLGCLLLELLTRAHPFEGTFPEPVGYIAYLSQVTYTDSVPRGDLYNIDDTCKSFLDACLQVNPGLRSSASTLLSHPFLATVEVTSGMGAAPTIANRTSLSFTPTEYGDSNCAIEK